MGDKDALEIDGFVFASMADAKIAENELKGIEYLKNKNNMDNPRAALVIYNKMVSEGLFHTPIGIGYLRDLQRALIENDSIDNNSIMHIPVEPLAEGISKKSVVDKIARVFSNSRKAYREKLKVSMTFNVILAIVIAAMFVISTTGNNVNIVNYEEKIIDKYAKWEEELTERENSLREQKMTEADRQTSAK